MNLSMKKVLSLVLASALVVSSAGTVDAAKKAQKVQEIPSANLTIQAEADKAVTGSAVVAVSTAAALATDSVLKCNYDASLVTSIADAKASVVSSTAIKVTVTATKGAVAVSQAAVAVLSKNTTIASVMVTVNAAPVETAKKKTKSLSIKKKVVIPAGESKVVNFTAKKTAAATKIQTVKVKSNNTEIVEASKVSGKKQIKLTVPAAAEKGAYTDVVLTSGKKTATIKVYVQNKARKIKAAKKKVTVKKGKTAKVTIKVTKAQNKKKAVTDALSATVAKKKVAKVLTKKAKKGKVVVSLKAKKKGSTKVTVKVGSKKATVTLKVK